MREVKKKKKSARVEISRREHPVQARGGGRVLVWPETSWLFWLRQAPSTLVLITVRGSSGGKGKEREIPAVDSRWTEDMASAGRSDFYLKPENTLFGGSSVTV